MNKMGEDGKCNKAFSSTAGSMTTQYGQEVKRSNWSDMYLNVMNKHAQTYLMAFHLGKGGGRPPMFVK
jgi:hypothetical protein